MAQAELGQEVLVQLVHPVFQWHLLVAVEEELHPTQTIVLRGRPEALQPWLERCTCDYAPRRLTLAIPDAAHNLPGTLAQHASRGDVTAYLCSGHACSAPVTTLAGLDSALSLPM